MVAVDHKSIHQVRNQNDCSGINKLFLAYFHQGQNNKQIVKMIQQLLRAREIDRRTQKQLLSAIGTPVKKKENSTASDINSFSMLESLLSRSRSRTDLEQTILIDQQLLQQLKLVENPVMREIVEIVLALKSGNIFWAQRVIEKILVSDYHQLIFMRKITVSNPEQRMKELKRNDGLMIKMFKLVEKYIEDKNLVRAFRLFFEYGMNSKELPRFFGYISQSDSLSSIRTLIKGRWGKRFPGLWFKVLMGKNHPAEAQAFLRVALAFPAIKHLDQGEMWLLAYHIPPSDSARKELRYKLEKLNKDNSAYAKYILLELMEQQPIIKKIMEEVDYEFRQPIYNLKRAFYRRLIQQRIASHFSLYQLIQLGDQDPWLLWQTAR